MITVVLPAPFAPVITAWRGDLVDLERDAGDPRRLPPKCFSKAHGFEHEGMDKCPSPGGTGTGACARPPIGA